jgi:hypothetical protein
MERSEALRPLSREHHGALVHGNRIKRGLTRGAELEQMRAYLLHVWASDLERHFALEEAAFSHASGWIQIGSAERSHMLGDHVEFRRLARQLEGSSDGRELRALLGEFAELLVNHVRFEERVLFPAIEVLFSGEELAAAGELLAREHVDACLSWEPVFWK